ncbi:H/ACA RNA-protein complex protein Gar1 [Candidatus Thorarchaeota archaeon]|nr:MAG: H/ACA RNA-protein complex protein Gar1 [Candidatus Thorarchaeota archaeon]
MLNRRRVRRKVRRGNRINLEPNYLRRLGKVLHISTRGSIIIRTEKTPPVGDKSLVMDKNAQEVGTIIDVFGPVKYPYISIKPKRGYDTKKLVGQMLYLYKKG